MHPSPPPADPPCASPDTTRCAICGQTEAEGHHVDEHTAVWLGRALGTLLKVMSTTTPSPQTRELVQCFLDDVEQDPVVRSGL